LSESKLDLFGKCLAAIMLACLLGTAVYYTSLDGNTQPNFAYAFTWFEGDQQQVYEDYADTTLLSHNLGMRFGLKNGTTVYVHDPYESPESNPEYQGSIESIINSLEVSLLNEWTISGATGVSSGVKITVGGPSFTSSPVANLTVFENTTISTILVTLTNTDMGSYTIWYGPDLFEASNTPGYWPDTKTLVTNSPTWSVLSTQLLDLLEGEGTATIEFNAVFSVHVDYEIALSENVTETGEKDLTWNGTMGTIKITYDTTRISQVQYDFKQIQLALLTMDTEP
jgi:hypothetical protein